MLHDLTASNFGVEGQLGNEHGRDVTMNAGIYKRAWLVLYWGVGQGSTGKLNAG